MKTICTACEDDFEIDKSGSGGMNRKLCYKCLPPSLGRKERKSCRLKALRKRASKEKVERGCETCGYDKCSSALEWHHEDAAKEDAPSNLLGISWEKYSEEIETCSLLCSICHREFHSDCLDKHVFRIVQYGFWTYTSFT